MMVLPTIINNWPKSVRESLNWIIFNKKNVDMQRKNKKETNRQIESMVVLFSKILFNPLLLRILIMPLCHHLTP